LPVRDNIALPLLLKGVKKKQAYQTADKWATLVGIENVASSLPHTLSGGETQRVAIARAMAIDPEVIFADEPTGSLDSVNAKKIMELFVDLAHKYNKTIILVTHSRETAAYADRIILLGDGIIESGASHGIA
jgi:putative ABC transport system ATP-binding protein